METLYSPFIELYLSGSNNKYASPTVPVNMSNGECQFWKQDYSKTVLPDNSQYRSETKSNLLQHHISLNL